jgi:hypothetical protein
VGDGFKLRPQRIIRRHVGLEKEMREGKESLRVKQNKVE